MKEENLTCGRPYLWHQVQRLSGCDKLGANRRMRNSLVFVPGIVEDRSVYTVARVLLLFRLKSHKDSGGIKDVFVQYMDCTSALDETDEELSCVCLRWSGTEEEDHSIVTREELNDKTELNASAWYKVERFNAVCSILHVVPDNYGLPQLSRSLLWAYHPFYINRPYREDFPKLGSIQTKE